MLLKKAQCFIDEIYFHLFKAEVKTTELDCIAFKSKVMEMPQ